MLTLKISNYDHSLTLSFYLYCIPKFDVEDDEEKVDDGEVS